MTSDGVRMRVTGIALGHPRLILFLAGLVAIAGLLAASRMPLRLFPALPSPVVIIRTPAPGLTPKAVEHLVTRPLERRLLGMDGLVRLRSWSLSGLSSVTVRFQGGGDVGRDRRLVAERLVTAARDLPSGVGTPWMMPAADPTGPALVAALTSSKRDLMTMRDLAAHLVRPRLLAVPGVARVAIFGGGARSYQIRVEPDRLIRFRIGFDQVIAAARHATGLAASGFIDTPNQRIVLASHGQAGGVAGLAATVVRSGAGGTAVTLGDVARVVAAPLPAQSGAAIMGRPAVRIEIYRQPDADPIPLNRALSRVLARLAPVLAQDGVQLDPDVVNSAGIVAKSAAGFGRAAAMGGLLVAATVLLLFFDLPVAAIALAAAVLSLLAAILVLYAVGMSANLMVLGGMTIAFAVVVNDALAGLVPLLRRLREGRLSPSPAGTVMMAWGEVDGWGAAAAAGLVALLPLFVLGGGPGAWVTPLAAAYGAAAAAALAISVTVTPVLAMALLAGRERRDQSWFFLRLTRRCRGPVRRLVEHPRLAAFWVLMALVALAILPALGMGPRPLARLGPLVVHMAALPGTSVAQSLRLGRQVTAALRAVPGVVTVSQRLGRAPGAGSLVGSWISRFDVTLGRGRHPGIVSRVRAALAPIPGIRVAVGWGLAGRVDPPRILAITATGDDLGDLDGTAKRIVGVLRKVPGVENPTLGLGAFVPQMNIGLRPAELRRWGVRPAQVLNMVGAAFAGRIVGHIYRGDRAIPVLVQMAAGADNPPAAVAGLLLRAPSGSFVRLGQLAQVGMGQGPAGISHHDGIRTVSVTAMITDGGKGMAAAKAAIARTIKPPAGVSLSYGGRTARPSGWVVLAGLAALTVAGALLSPVVGGGRGLALLLAILPPSLLGGVAVAAASGGLSPAALVGLAAVLVLALRQGTLLLARYRRLVGVDGEIWDAASAARGALEGLPSLAATALATGLGLAPALGTGVGLGAVAVILAGLASTAGAVLLVLPALALRWGRFDQAR